MTNLIISLMIAIAIVGVAFVLDSYNNRKKK